MGNDLTALALAEVMREANEIRNARIDSLRYGLGAAYVGPSMEFMILDEPGEPDPICFERISLEEFNRRGRPPVAQREWNSCALWVLRRALVVELREELKSWWGETGNES